MKNSLNQDNVKRELCIMISHYIRDKHPAIYTQLRSFFSQDSDDLDSELNLRYANFPPDQFMQFLKTLTPEDDFPSLFRRMTLFTQPPDFDPNICHLDLLCSNCFHNDSIFSIEFDPLSRFFITGSDDNLIKIISLPNFREIAILKGHTDVISNVYLNYDISLLLSSSHDASLRLWSLNTGQCLSVLTGITTSDIHYALFSPNGQLIAAACEDGSLCMWKTEDALKWKAPFMKMNSPEGTPVVWLAFSPGSEFFGFVAEPNRVIILSMSTNKQFELKLHTGKITYVTFSRRLYPSPYGMAPKILTFSDEEGSLSIWTIKSSNFSPFQVFKPQTTGKKYRILATCWDYDDHLAVIVRQSSIVVFDTISGKTISTLPDINEISGCYMLAANPKFHNLFAFVTGTGVFSVWDIHELEQLATASDKSDVVYHEVKWSPCGRFILVSDSIGRVLIFSFTFNDHRCSLINLTAEAKRTSDLSEGNLMNFQVNLDMSFYNQCEREEKELSRKLLEIGDNGQASPERGLSVVIAQPPDPIRVILKKPNNPFVLLPLDDPASFKESNQNSNINSEVDEIILANNNTNNNTNTNYNNSDDEETNQNMPHSSHSYLDELDDLVFESENELSPMQPPKDPSNFVIYEPFNRYDKPRWLIALSTTVYIPQVGDQVLYIHSANLRGLVENVNYQFLLTTRAQIQKLSVIEEGYIITLQIPYLTGTIDFRIYFSFIEYCDYLFPLSALPSFLSLLKKIQIGHIIEYRANALRFNGEVISLKESAEVLPFESITVTGLDETLSISPWQLLEVEGVPVTNPYAGSDEAVSLATAKTLETVAKSDDFSMFYDLAERMNADVLQPMDMKFIIERLRNGWYRTTLALQDDINILAGNIRRMNNHPEVQAINNLVFQFMDLVKRNVIKIS